ncbi:MAG: TonB-dependent receptor, partial [Acidobacteria bacterium]|nr:TonB-dependent receptor [Acidobacteriota bacterium]
MDRSAWRALGIVCLALSLGTSAFAQATTSLSGVVKDSAGGVIPGATVVVTENSTGTSYETVTNATGVYSIPGLQAGTYTVTASLTGFKTAQVNTVRIALDTPAAVNMTLEVGALTETVNVTSSTELVNTQTATVAATLNADQLNRMPTSSRNAINAVMFLPGINTATTNRESRANGLPESFVQITMDGVSNNDNFNRSTDGFFASVSPRQDAVEAVTVTLAAGGAQQGGSGAIQIQFQTRSGGNQFTGSLYEYYRSPELNSTYYFNKINGLAKNDVKLNQYGGRAGGPIYIPGVLDGRGKAFFFANYEEIRFPNSFTLTRNVLHPRAVEGLFRYNSGGTVREVDVLALAAASGQIAAKDPLTASLLAKIAAATASTGTVNETADPLVNSYVHLSPSKLFERQPTVRVDFNISDRHRLTATWAYIFAERNPDYLNNAQPRFPGAPNHRIFDSTRPRYTATLRSTLTANLVNELTAGITALGGESNFGRDASNGPQTFADQGGFAIDFDDNIGLTNWFTSNSPSWRSAPTYTVTNRVSWQRGSHSLQFGGEFFRNTADENAKQIVPGIDIGFNTQFDPAAGLFTTANFPGASSGQLTDARELYSLLTGRVIAVTGQAALDPDTNRYVPFAARTRAGRIDMYSAFAQDSWRVTPTLTLTAGLRWDVQMPFVALNDVMSAVTMDDVCGMSGIGANSTVYNRCNFFQPGANSGKQQIEFVQLTRGTNGYSTDWNNIAPSVSVAWRPNVQSGWVRTLLGSPEQATLRAGWSVAYERQGMGQFTNVFGANPGSTITLTRDTNTGLVPAGEAWPVLLSQTERLGNAAFNETPVFPILARPNRADSLTAFSPDIQIGRAMTWTVGFQRSLGDDMAMEVRYVGTRGDDQWSTLNYNTIRGESLLNNGFLDEFRLAMTNLQANNASGVSSRSGSFAYFGTGSGTSPLPIYLAYLNGRTDPTNPSAYSGGTSTWRSTTFASRLSAASPNSISAANDLNGNSTRRANALKAGLPANFFIPNPAMNNVNVRDSGAFSDYHALQIELRRRLSRGLSANVNYQYAIEGGSAFDGFSFGRTMESSANVRHAFKGQFDWTLPVGRGQRFGANMHPVLDAIIGGWSVNGVGRVQARTLDFGNVRLVGMTTDELTKMYKFYRRTNASTGRVEIWMLPEDVILNTRRAFSVSNTTADGYSTSLGTPTGRYIAPANSATCIQTRAGDCAPRATLIRAPWFTRIDIGVTKRFNIKGTTNIEV